MIIVKNVLTGEEVTRYTELSGKWSCVVNDINGNGYKLYSTEIDKDENLIVYIY